MVATPSILTIVITAVLIQIAMLSAEDCKTNRVTCRKLNIFNLEEDYSRKDESDCRATETPKWAKKIVHYFNRHINETVKDSGKNGRKITVGIKQLLRMLMYSLIELPCERLDCKKLSTDVIEAFEYFPKPANTTLTCKLNQPDVLTTRQPSLCLVASDESDPQ
ncbi:uncharacterized protein LOC117107311 [Anneissia japonica]|uniref:uncharacterized protein LOC117107311 n=1 Tax=Anneissia japonica TaxID=1529436 RepID=UPI001425884D|nr:uncharacterized protein LOC117107311 [Anneissia japonica]